MNPVVRHASALFISDLHLTPERPEGLRWFHTFMERRAAGAEALFILGDFFEYWLGDDALSIPFNLDVTHQLKRFSSCGGALYFMAGNRDFLVGQAFAEAAGLTLLDDPCIVELSRTPTLLCHGDTLCTDDSDYLRFRSQLRAPLWQRDFLAKPLPERLEYARGLRMQSEAVKSTKPMEIMDVNPGEVLRQMQAHGVDRLIHGHTHRPMRHSVSLPSGEGERWVLPAWYEQGGLLACGPDGCQLEAWTDQ